VNKITILVILSLATFIACTRPSPQSTVLLVQNVYGEGITWKQFPIVFTFHESVPLEYRKIIIEEMNQFNILSKEEIFKVSENIASSKESNQKPKDGQNIIYFDFNKSFEMTPSEQGKTSVYWVGNDIKEADINIQTSRIIQIDFKTLIRHELCHVLGIKHNERVFDLLSSSLPENTTRNLTPELISLWKQEVGIAGARFSHREDLASVNTH
jgi:hypothetical protein